VAIRSRVGAVRARKHQPAAPMRETPAALLKYVVVQRMRGTELDAVLEYAQAGAIRKIEVVALRRVVRRWRRKTMAAGMLDIDDGTKPTVARYSHGALKMTTATA
jgi:hypothetical protein